MASYLVHPRTRTALSTKNLAAGVVGQLCALNALNLVRSTAPTTVLLPALSGEGECVIVEDFSDLAATNNITIDGNGDTIDGAATLVLNVNGAIAALVFDEGEWKRVTPVRLFEASSNPVPFARTTDLVGAVGATNDFEFIRLGPAAATKASSGLIRFPFSAAAFSYMRGMTGAAAEEDILRQTGASALIMGHQDNWNLDIYASSLGLWGKAAFILYGQDGNEALRIFTAGPRIANGKYLQFGSTSPAASGDIRGRNNFKAVVRDVADAADICAWRVDASDFEWIGTDGGGTQQAARLHLNGSAVVEVTIATATRIRVDTSAECQVADPIVGFSSPYGLHGGFAYAFAADANYTLTAGQYKYAGAAAFMQFDTGAITAGRTVTFPAPSSLERGYSVFIYNATTQSLTFSTGVGSTRTIASLFGRRLHFDSTGVRNAGNLVTV